MFHRKILSPILLTLWTAAACSPASVLQTGIDPYVALDSTVFVDPRFIGGIGSVLFVSPFSEGTESTQINLTVSVPEGASISLHAFASSNLTEGIDLRFSRLNNVYQVTLEAEGSSENISSSFSSSSLSEALNLSIDVHNGVSPARVIIWNRNSTDTSDALFDSTASGSNTPGNGAGRFVGLTIDQALVTLIHMGEARISP